MRFTTNHRQDIYFEISKFANANAAEHYAFLKTQSWLTGEMSIGDAEITMLDHRPDIAFALQRGTLKWQ